MRGSMQRERKRAQTTPDDKESTVKRIRLMGKRLAKCVIREIVRQDEIVPLLIRNDAVKIVLTFNVEIQTMEGRSLIVKLDDTSATVEALQEALQLSLGVATRNQQLFLIDNLGDGDEGESKPVKNTDIVKPGSSFMMCVLMDCPKFTKVSATHSTRRTMLSDDRLSIEMQGVGCTALLGALIKPDSKDTHAGRHPVFF